MAETQAGTQEETQAGTQEETQEGTQEETQEGTQEETQAGTQEETQEETQEGSSGSSGSSGDNGAKTQQQETLASSIAVNPRKVYPVYSFNYMLRVEFAFDVPCKSIRAFEKKNEYEYIQEGGLNDYVHMRRKPISAPFTFEIERYVGTNFSCDYVDPLANGTELLCPLLLFVSRAAGKENKAVRTYVFTGCTVMGKKYGELNAERSGLLTEITTIGYRELYLFNTPTNFY